MKKSPKSSHTLAEVLNSKRLTLILLVTAAVLMLAIAAMLLLMPGRNQTADLIDMYSGGTEPTKLETVPPTDPIESIEAVPGVVEPEMLPHMALLYSKNSDMVGRVTIPDTVLDYPVMYTPDDGMKYLYRNFEGKFSSAGQPLLDTRCSVDPESMVLMIHGHNMVNGTMFKTLLSYASSSYWKNHPEIIYTTLYEERTYEIFAAFFDEVYAEEDDVFKFYEFINPQTEEEYNEGISYFKSRSKFDSGITPEFGQRLLMLVTCEYSTPNGRFVVVAREVPNE